MSVSCRIISATAVTVSSCTYLLQPKPKKEHGHGHGDEDHGDHEEHENNEEHEERPEEDGTESGDEREESKEEEAPSDAGKEQTESNNDSESDGEVDETKDTPDTSEDEGEPNVAHEKDSGGNVEGVQFKGATKGGTEDGEQGDTRKHIPDAKGANKLRIESHYGKKQGETEGDGFTRNEDGTKSDEVG